MTPKKRGYLSDVLGRGLKNVAQPATFLKVSLAQKDMLSYHILSAVLSNFNQRLALPKLAFLAALPTVFRTIPLLVLMMLPM